ncbi:helix-turn-helix transcriptional regulator [Streptomyces sp. NBC_01481]|uniref:helix-turn-helix domain-containing protein n=1 Tax=Streptomyces sp. NBC_01481 TaxID=2975869 RepID=UPI00225732EF|nr:helix-turn-helix transcriptional regulator [Streptomyces sp. NBC_01481]MCX4584548.1 helix-turn-helix domain-containing protein [Streptomyces sp. NBC_01481]
MHTSERGSRSFGALLRFYRERADLSQEALAGRIGFSKSQVAMVERGERQPRGRFVADADEVLGAQGALVVLASKEFEDSGVPPWTEDYLAEEKKAVSLHSYQSHVIPGALQTEAYARAVFNCNYCPPLDDEEIEKRVEARLERQNLFHRKPTPIISYVLEQSALTRPLGGPSVLREQLHHVLGIGRLRHVEIQVMPHDRQTHAGLAGPMILLETAERRQLAYIEGHRGGYFVSEQPDLGDLFGKYGILRAQALNPEESAKLIEQVAEGL